MYRPSRIGGRVIIPDFGISSSDPMHFLPSDFGSVQTRGDTEYAFSAQLHRNKNPLNSAIVNSAHFPGPYRTAIMPLSSLSISGNDTGVHFAGPINTSGAEEVQGAIAIPQGHKRTIFIPFWTPPTPYKWGTGNTRYLMDIQAHLSFMRRGSTPHADIRWGWVWSPLTHQPDHPGGGTWWAVGGIAPHILDQRFHTHSVSDNIGNIIPGATQDSGASYVTIVCRDSIVTPDNIAHPFSGAEQANKTAAAPTTGIFITLYNFTALFVPAFTGEYQYCFNFDCSISAHLHDAEIDTWEQERSL